MARAEAWIFSLGMVLAACFKREGWQRPEPPLLATDDLAAVTAQDHDDPGAPLRVIDSR